MLSENIKNLRAEYDLSQEELAKIAGVSSKAVSTWENGTRIPRMGAIQRMADYFCISKSDIIEDNRKLSSPAPIVDAASNEMLSMFNQLNADGQRRVLDYTDDLLSSGRYAKKDDTVSGIA